MLDKLIARAPRLARLLLPYVAATKHFNTLKHLEYRRQATKALLQSGKFSPKIEQEVHLLPIKFIADQMFLRFAPPECVASMKPRIVESDDNFFRLRQKLSDGRSILFGCSYFGSVYYTLLCLEGLVKDLLIVTAGDPTRAAPLFQKIGQISGININVVGANEPSVAIAILRKFKEGGAVATMLDCFYGTKTDDVSEFLGRPAASPGVLYRIAHKAQAIIVPTASIHRERTLFLDIGNLIDMRETTAESASRSVNDYFTRLVNAHAEQWMGWPNLLARWELPELRASR